MIKLITIKYLILWKLMFLKYRILFFIDDIRIKMTLRRCEKLEKKLKNLFEK